MFSKSTKIEKSARRHGNNVGIRRGKSILNFLVNSVKDPFFLYAIDASHKEKTGPYVTNVLKNTIMEVSAENVVQVCTDNASNYVLAGKIIEETFPHILWTPFGHTLWI